jgi:hypothetical protein
LKDKTANQETNAIERRQRLVKKIDRLRVLHRQHLSDVPVFSYDADNPESTTVLLPSNLPSTYNYRWLRKAEEDLREAAARESLSALQHHLRTRDVWLDFKQKHIRGVASCTRMNHAIGTVHAKIRAAATAYRRHRAALISLRGDGGWCNELRQLQEEDIRGLNERSYTAKEQAENSRRQELTLQLNPDVDDDPKGRLQGSVQVGGHYLGKAPVQVGEGRRALSWLWYNPGLLDGAGLEGDTQLVGGKHRVIYYYTAQC